jgi:hypothetical protein
MVTPTQQGSQVSTGTADVGTVEHLSLFATAAKLKAIVALHDIVAFVSQENIGWGAHRPQMNTASPSTKMTTANQIRSNNHSQSNTLSSPLQTATR